MNLTARPTARGRLRPVLLAGVVLLVALFLALGVWQVQRRAWKHELIAAVDARVHAAPAAAPAPAGWPAITPARDAYRKLRVTGRFLEPRGTLVRAVSDLGAGYWVMTPFDARGFIVLVNRGFVPQDRRDGYDDAPKGPTTVTGLLRTSEPGGGFLRANDPAAGRWYSRDVAAIAAAKRLEHVAPYFIDAEAETAPGPDAYPRGGLTVIRFTDNHLAYALTWFAMAALTAWGGWWVARGRPSGRG